MATRSRRRCWRRCRGSDRAPGSWASTSSAGRRRWGRSASRCGASGIRATSARSCAPRSPSAPRRSRSARAAPIRSAPRPCAPRWGRSSSCPWRGSRASRSCPASASRSSAHAGEVLSRAVGAEATVVVGAERGGLPEDVLAACDRVAPHPDRDRVAQRRDGGDGRTVRGHAGDDRRCLSSGCYPRDSRRCSRATEPGQAARLGWRAHDRPHRRAARGGRGGDRRRPLER